MFLITSKKVIFRSTVFSALFFAAMVISVAYAKENPALVSFSDLYFYKDGKKAPLSIAPKIIIRFKGGGDEEGRAALLASLQSVGQEKVRFWGDSLLVHFLPTISPDEVLKKVTQTRESGKADAAPVFVFEGREAVIDGILVEPTTTVSVPFMQESLRRIFGGISFHQFFARGKEWYVTFPELFFLDGAKDPLHVLLLANLLETKGDKAWAPWLKHARPELRFLSEGIIAKVTVEPLTATVGEKRTLTLSLSVLSDDFRVNENLVPVFGEGDFIPRFGANAAPGTSFFRVVGERKREERRIALGKVISYSWNFTLRVPEKEWVILEQKIPYEKKDGSVGEILSEKTTFFSILHTSAGAKLDIPAAEALPFPRLPLALKGVSPTDGKAAPPRLLDSFVAFVGGAEKAKLTMTLTAALSGGGAFIFSAYLLFPIFSRRSRAEQAEEALIDVSLIADECKYVLSSFPREHVYGALSAVLARLLHAVEPTLPEDDFSLEKVKQLRESGVARGLLADEDALQRIMALDRKISLRYAHDFTPRDGDIQELAADIIRFAEFLSARAKKHKEEGGAYARA